MPKTLKRLKPDPTVVRLQNLLSASGYFRSATPAHGIFEDVTHEEVELFQLQHQGPDGRPLTVDGIVGEHTWWALRNASGDPQRSHLAAVIPDGISDIRRTLLEVILAEHAKDVREVPDGSNRGPHIDRYWGNTGVIGLPWCCAFVSWALHDTLGHYPVGGRHHLGVQVMWRAARQAGLGTREPKPGDLFIQIMAGGKGHTGFVIGVTPAGDAIYTCEGNVGNRLKVGRRQRDTIHHYIDCMGPQGPDFERSTFDVKSVDLEGTR